MGDGLRDSGIDRADIWVTTFRAGDPMGEAPRALYLSMGFQANELTEEFGYPCQRFVLSAEKRR